MLTVKYSKKQLSPIIAKYGIDVENDKVFHAIITLFPEQTNYHMWAIKAVYGNVVKLEVINNVQQWVKDNQTEIHNLIKGNIVGYKTKEDFDQLHKEIVGLNNIKIVRNEISKFNTDQRNEFMGWAFQDIKNGLDAYNSEHFKNHLSFFKKFASLNKKTQNKLIVSVSAFRNQIPEMVKIIEGAFAVRYKWNKDDMLGFMARNCEDCSVIYNEGDIVIAKIGSYASSEKLCGNGRTTWCITNRESYWRSYVTESNRLQYFAFDFSKREDDELAHIGFTVDRSRGIVEAQSTQNLCLMSSGIDYHGKNFNINDFFMVNKIPTTIYMKLGDLKYYKWTVDAFLSYMNDNQVKASFANDNIVVFEIGKNVSFANRCISHTLINGGTDGQGDESRFVLINFNATKDDASSIYIFKYKKDKYGLDHCYNVVNALGKQEQFNNVLAAFNIDESNFINIDEVSSSILLHKYIDEENEKEALRILDKEDVDVNYVINYSTPIFDAITHRQLHVFAKIYSHKKFNNKTIDANKECILGHLMYDYMYVEDIVKQMAKQGRKTEEQEMTKELGILKTMIDIVLEDKTTDLNYVNLNLDTPVNIACESKGLEWVAKKLIANENVDVNKLNDYVFAALGNAIRNQNYDIIPFLAKRKDLDVREKDVRLASRMGVDLLSMLGREVDKKAKNQECDVVKTYKEIFDEVFKIAK